PGLKQPAPGEAVIDWSKDVVIPGLFDCHDHLTMDFDDGNDPKEDWAIYLTARAVRNGDRLLRAGITTIRDLGAKNSINIKLRRLVEQGLMKGPDIVTSGQMIVRTGYPEWAYCREADGPIGFRNAVRLERKAGADLAKLMVTGSVAGAGSTPEAFEMRPDELKAAIDEAHALGIKIAGHIYGGPAAAYAIEYGMDSIEHGAFLKDADIEAMAKKGTYLCVTYGVFPYIETYPNLPDYWYIKAKQASDRYADTLKKVKAAGVKVAVGGDGYHGDPATEMKALVDAGFAPMEALQALTKNGADLCGLLDRKGTLEAGKQADVVALKRDPLTDPLAVRAVAGVVKAGEQYV
ncbi:MAG: metal-dependent hydrolase family protein, partial [Bacillota bacterium]